jgi:hypothetical protein
MKLLIVQNCFSLLLFHPSCVQTFSSAPCNNENTRSTAIYVHISVNVAYELVSVNIVTYFLDLHDFYGTKKK